jgi:hypothetical protein
MIDATFDYLVGMHEEDEEEDATAPARAAGKREGGRVIRKPAAWRLRRGVQNSAGTGRGNEDGQALQCEHSF